MFNKLQEAVPSPLGPNETFLSECTMKYAKTFNLLLVVLAISLGVAGCTKKKPIVTPIPGVAGKPISSENPSGIERGTPLPPVQDVTANPNVNANPTGIPLTARNLEDFVPHPDQFAANTVYFDFDRATIKPSETGKLDGVVSHLKANPTHAVQIEGHCDERGTEQYNLSLGERRALAVREYLVTAGIAPERVFTISYGETRPAVQGHNEAAWSKNRRGVFVLLTPK
jgi:peptidoglycan-associated lipoprotein